MKASFSSVFLFSFISNISNVTKQKRTVASFDVTKVQNLSDEPKRWISKLFDSIVLTYRYNFRPVAPFPLRDELKFKGKNQSDESSHL